MQIEGLQPYQKNNQIEVFSCDFPKFFKTAKQHLLAVTLGISASLAMVIKALRIDLLCYVHLADITVELKLRNPKRKSVTERERERERERARLVPKVLYHKTLV